MEFQHAKANPDALADRDLCTRARSALAGCCDISTYVHANHGVSRRVPDRSGGYGLQVQALAACTGLCLRIRYRPGGIGSSGIWTRRANNPVSLRVEAHVGWIWKACWFPIHTSAGQGCSTIPLWINSE